MFDKIIEIMDYLHNCMRQHAIILTNDGLFHWRIHESLDLNELNWATTDMDSAPSQPRHTSPMM